MNVHTTQKRIHQSTLLGRNITQHQINNRDTENLEAAGVRQNAPKPRHRNLRSIHATQQHITTRHIPTIPKQ